MKKEVFFRRTPSKLHAYRKSTTCNLFYQTSRMHTFLCLFFNIRQSRKVGVFAIVRNLLVDMIVCVQLRQITNPYNPLHLANLGTNQVAIAISLLRLRAPLSYFPSNLDISQQLVMQPPRSVDNKYKTLLYVL